MIDRKKLRKTSMLAGLAAAGLIGAGSAQAATPDDERPIFEVRDVKATGVVVAEEGSCGEGKCGEGKCGEGSCGGGDDDES